MRFTKPFWAGIADGTITVAFRRWKSPTVVAGRAYRTGGGRVEVTSVEIIEPSAITARDATGAGFGSVEEAVAALPAPTPDRELYRVGFELLDEPDPRETLAMAADLTAEDMEAIGAKLLRLDNAGKAGPWTEQTLRLIAANPARRAPDLAEMMGRETKPFKLDVRKLKNLGLTRSLKIGYEMSPRGAAYLAAIDETGAIEAT